MKINFETINKDEFNVNEKVLSNGELVYLVTPTQGVIWNQKNKIFRSSLWNKDGNLISAGFPKFTNWGESPLEFPTPNDLKGTTIIEKIDGSLLIVSKYKGQYIIRTRGTTNAFELENGQELNSFKENILEKIKNDIDTWDYSILFEWVSPTNCIVIQYEKLEWYLIGCIYHENYSLMSQNELDEMAKKHGFLRPSFYTFSTLTNLLNEVKEWKGKEGVCIYSNKDQVIHKVKSSEYLTLHYFKSNATFENTLDLFFALGKPSYMDFEKKLIEKFDYECFNMIKGYASTICDAYKEVLKIVDGFSNFIEKSLKPLPTRKEQAAEVFKSYGKESNRASFIFSMLDGKKLTDEQLKKLMYQVTKTKC